MKKVVRKLLVLACIPALASCSEKTLKASEALKIVNGEGEYSAYVHDPHNINNRYKKLTLKFERLYSNGKSLKDIEKVEDEAKRASLNEQYRLTTQNTLNQRGALLMMPLIAGLEENKETEREMNILQAEFVCNARAVLEDYQYLSENKPYSNYPTSETISYHFGDRVLKVNYSFSDEESDVMVLVNGKNVKANIGYCYNLEAEYGPTGEVTLISYIVTSAHKQKEAEGNQKQEDVDPVETYDYAFGMRLQIDYELK